MNDTKQSTSNQKLKWNHKDGIFRRLFNDKEKLLELYNAISGTHYPKGTKIEIVTLDNVIFGDRKNDLAFILGDRLIILIDHQSTYCPNMPLRMLEYIAREYETLFFSSEIYSSRLLRIPTPEFYIFYNGSQDRPLVEKMKLSDAFREKCDTLSLELVVTVINVNHEQGAEILRRCQTLSEYSQFIRILRQFHSDLGDKEAAAQQCVKYCMEQGILKDFLKRNGGDVVSFLFDELTREECLAIREEDAYLRGLEDGEAKGFADGKTDEQKAIALRMLQNNLDHELILEMTGLSREQLDSLLPL